MWTYEGLLLACMLVNGLAAPNIVFVMLDDAGFADMGYSNPDGMIHTPFIDKLVDTEGIKLDWYYVHPTCTPSRASFLTGRYAVNSGVPFAVLPGSPVGIPADVPVLAEVLRDHPAHYISHMVGKWHVGYGYWSQLPVSRGFASFTGSLDIDIDSYTKQMRLTPYSPGAVDWMSAWANGSYVHFAEARHPTEALTNEAQDIMRRHVRDTSMTGRSGQENDVDEDEQAGSPLFLYVSFPAPHSPCQPIPAHTAPCRHIPHKWRRDFCGMMVGIDEALANLTHTIREVLGPDSVLVVSSDNGGSPWNGGMNYPLRGGKFSAWEGGIRVPAFIVDFTPDKRYFGAGGRSYEGLVHISDWLPTLLALAAPSTSGTSETFQSGPLPTGLDGVDMSKAIRLGLPSPRETILSELYEPGDRVHGGMWAVGYRSGRYKLVEGLFEDLSYCSESTINMLNCTSTGSSWADLVQRVGQIVFQFAEWVYGDAEMDSVKGAVLLAHIQRITLELQGAGHTYLFDLEVDPGETTNLAEALPDVVDGLRREVQIYRAARPVQGKYWMVLPVQEQRNRYYPGDCSSNRFLKPEDCVFKHPFMTGPEDENLFVHAIPEFTRVMLLSFLQGLTHKLLKVVILIAGVFILRRVLIGNNCHVKVKHS